MKFKQSVLIAFFSSLLTVIALVTYRGLSQEEHKTPGFSVEKIIMKDSISGLKNDSAAFEPFAPLFEKPFFFLGKGKQFYAFISSDGTHVIKFFQQQRFVAKKVKTWPSFVRDHLYKMRVEKLKQRHLALIESVTLSHDLLGDETAVRYVHIAKTFGELPHVTLVDHQGELYTVDLNDTQFVIQKKAELLKSTIVQLMAKKDEAEAKKRIEALFDLLVSCARKGVEDGDGALVRNDNVGFINGKAVYIDFGKLEQTDAPINEVRFRHTLRRLKPLHKWLRNNYPTLAVHFDECRERIVFP